MICPKCRNEIADDSVFCNKCGYKFKRAPQGKTIELDIRVLIGVLACVIVFWGFVGISLYNSKPDTKYKKAEKLLGRDEYARAVDYYSQIEGYKDASDKKRVAELAMHHGNAQTLISEEKYDEALDELHLCRDYSDSKELIKSCYYGKGLSYKANNDYENAAINFQSANGFQDSNDQIMDMGKQLVIDSDYTKAEKVYSYVDIEVRSDDPYANYAEGMVALEEQDYGTASAALKNAGDILEAKKNYEEAEYYNASNLLESGDYDSALEAFENVSEYSDSSEMINACNLMIAKELLYDGEFSSAESKLNKVPDGTSYDGYSKSSLLDKIDKYSAWKDICGDYTVIYGVAKTLSQDKDDGESNGYWTMDFSYVSDYKLTISCEINEDDTVSVKGTGKILIFDNWTKIESLLDKKEYAFSFTETFNVNNDFGGTFGINSDVTISIYSDSIALSYYKINSTSSEDIDYIYTTEVSYQKD